jgi:hypothetical protein
LTERKLLCSGTRGSRRCVGDEGGPSALIGGRSQCHERGRQLADLAGGSLGEQAQLRDDGMLAGGE